MPRTQIYTNIKSIHVGRKLRKFWPFAVPSLIGLTKDDFESYKRAKEDKAKRPDFIRARTVGLTQKGEGPKSHLSQRKTKTGFQTERRNGKKAPIRSKRAFRSASERSRHIETN